VVLFPTAVFLRHCHVQELEEEWENILPQAGVGKHLPAMFNVQSLPTPFSLCYFTSYLQELEEEWEKAKPLLKEVQRLLQDLHMVSLSLTVVF
jgi:hypothetical protein